MTNDLITFLENARINNLAQSISAKEYVDFMKTGISNENANLIMYLFEKFNGFTTSPASCKYHGSFIGGLFVHSMGVYEAALKMASAHNVPWVDPIACIFHDVCKVGAYEIDEYKSTPEKTAFKYANNLGLPHGSESVRRLLKAGVQLSDAWEFAIAYHMGAFNANSEDTINFGKMCEKYPQVLLLHNADMVASKIYGV